MGVADLLGIDHGEGELMAVAERRWPSWVAADERLKPVPQLKDLRPWLKRSSPVEADEVLQALAKRGSMHGGDELAAAAALAYVLLPGACTVASRLRSISPRIDEIVAAQLWLEIRTFRCEELTRVAANILMNTRVGALRECEAASQLLRTDRTWHDVWTMDPRASDWGDLLERADQAPTAAEQVLDLLEWGRENRVISEQDRSLLLSILAAADRVEPGRSHGRGGLLSNRISEAVAQEVGLSPVTVRRRAAASIQALTDACASRGISA